MHKNKLYYRIILFLTAVIIIFSFAGCKKIFKRPGGQKNKKQSQQQSSNKKDPPVVLNKMEKTTKKVIDEISKVKEKQLNASKQQDKKEKKESDTNKSDKKDEAGKNKSDKKKDNKDKDKNKTESKKQITKINWPSMEKDVKTIHSLWNEYEIQARKDGAENELIDKYKKQLNILTEKILAKEQEKALIEANILYSYYPKFLNLYKHKAPPEILDIKFYIKQIIIYAENNDWEKAVSLIPEIDKSWTTTKAKIEKPDIKLNEKIESSINDFTNVVEERKLDLIKLKGEIVNKNLDRIK